MSNTAREWAKSWGGEITSPQKFVLLMICDYYNDEKGYAWPSIAALARDTCLNVSTVTRALRALEDKGLIETENRRKAGSRELTSNKYTLPLYATPQDEKPVVQFGPRGRTTPDQRAAQTIALGRMSRADENAARYRQLYGDPVDNSDAGMRREPIPLMQSATTV